jgi:hypothetical protein
VRTAAEVRAAPAEVRRRRMTAAPTRVAATAAMATATAARMREHRRRGHESDQESNRQSEFLLHEMSLRHHPDPSSGPKCNLFRIPL